MDTEQESKWNAAHIVDRNCWLYQGQALQWAIYRYNACWLPLLAKHSESKITEGPLVVPLDCEWIWHCHRLNLVRYKSDYEKFYGSILDNSNVVSSINQRTSRKEIEETWNKLYPNDPMSMTCHVLPQVNFEKLYIMEELKAFPNMILF
ncbi:unnamed protein product [Lactuca virosa]|uniref:Uncharacterized protein n=1 Tax=Lactuca virosa TaxID=75947 RepID=A0AAU9MAW9_9ASTR|nr:unnamed protein product [Lactuca virosa]